MNRGLFGAAKYLARAAPVAAACQLSWNNRGNCASFSAATYPANDPIEDRHLHKHVGEWGVAAVFDGHGGWQISDLVSQVLVDKVMDGIVNVSEKDEITVDEKILAAFESMEKDVVSRVRSAFNLGFGEVAKVGSCVLLAFKKADRLIVANCGDCRAILGSTVPIATTTPEKNTTSPDTYVSTRINRDHNARVRLEQLRLEQDHPGEPGLFRCKNPHACYVKGRLQLTRSIGDEYLKSQEFNGSKDKHRSRYFCTNFALQKRCIYPCITHAFHVSLHCFVIVHSFLTSV